MVAKPSSRVIPPIAADAEMRARQGSHAGRVSAGAPREPRSATADALISRRTYTTVAHAETGASSHYGERRIGRAAPGSVLRIRGKCVSTHGAPWDVLARTETVTRT